MFLLRTRRPERYGKWIERMLAPENDEEADPLDAAIRLDGGIEQISWHADKEGDDSDSEAP